MAKSSIEAYLPAEEIVRRARAAGFCAAGILDGAELTAQGRLAGAAALLVVALPYGNDSVPGQAAPGHLAPPAAAADDAAGPTDGRPAPGFGRIAPFARRNYYAEAIFRLQNLARDLRKDYGGRRADYRILCNSPIPEKPLAAAAGIGQIGRNSLVITAEAGSLAVLAALTLPAVRFREPIPPPAEAEPFEACRCCLTPEGRPEPACAAACPTAALPGDGTLIREKCIQWYASGNGESVPGEVAAVWGDRFYGCTDCQDACPHNRRPVAGADTARGVLDEAVDVRGLLALEDEELLSRFRGTALGLSWLGPAALRRNAELVLAASPRAGKGQSAAQRSRPARRKA